MLETSRNHLSKENYSKFNEKDGEPLNVVEGQVGRAGQSGVEKYRPAETSVEREYQQW